MKSLIEITILIGLNLFLFGFVQRKMAILVIAQRNQIRSGPLLSDFEKKELSRFAAAFAPAYL